MQPRIAAGRETTRAEIGAIRPRTDGSAGAQQCCTELGAAGAAPRPKSSHFWFCPQPTACSCDAELLEGCSTAGRDASHARESCYRPQRRTECPRVQTATLGAL